MTELRGPDPGQDPADLPRTAGSSRSPGIPELLLRGGPGGQVPVPIPQLGFGTWQVTSEQVGPALATAFEAGYRHVDTARLYHNEEAVGAAVRTWQQDRSTGRIFVTTKVWNDDHLRVRAAFDESMSRLGLDVLDLLLIHWPCPTADHYVPAWCELLALRDEGRVRAVGVSNFAEPHLRRLAEETGEFPAVNQIELHPLLQQQALRAFHERHGILTQSWTPLAGGLLQGDPVVAAVAAKHSVTPARVLLRWQVDLGLIVIPRSVTPARIRENADLFSFALDADDLAALARLDRGRRTGPDPEQFG